MVLVACCSGGDGDGDGGGGSGGGGVGRNTSLQVEVRKLTGLDIQVDNIEHCNNSNCQPCGQEHPLSGHLISTQGTS